MIMIFICLCKRFIGRYSFNTIFLVFLSQVTWADLALVDVGFTMIDLYPTAFDKSPLLKALYDRVMALPAVKKHCDTRPTSPL